MQIWVGPPSGLQEWSLPAASQFVNRAEGTSSPRLSHSSVITSAWAQQVGHQVTTVLPLRTTNRLSVSIVILVVFITTACSDLPIATAAASY